MIDSQITVLIILASTLALFLYGRWRYDFVAIVSLVTLALTGLVPPEKMFSGFGHPAVITVAAVLAISAALENAGVVDRIYHIVSRLGNSLWQQAIFLNLLIALLSGFMNNIGALAITLPVAMQLARKHEVAPSFLLMPLAFSALLGGMTTMIGTPPNIIVAMMRGEQLGAPFSVFDFSYVGLGVAFSGVTFLSLCASYFLPERKGKTLKEELFDIEEYLTELKFDHSSSFIGQKLHALEESVEGSCAILGIYRKKQKIVSPSMNEVIKSGDLLVIEAEPETLESLIAKGGISIIGDQKHRQEIVESEEVSLIEAVVQPNSSLLRKQVGKLRLQWRFGLHLLAVSRAGQWVAKRLSDVKIRVGDVLLLRGEEGALTEALTTLKCLPLQYRGLKIGETQRIILSITIFAAAILLTSFSIFPIQLAFTLAVIVMHLFQLIKLREIYESIDWPIIILLGAMIPLGGALETTGAAETLAQGIIQFSGGEFPIITLAVVLIGTMFLSDLVNNATAAVLMVPIAINVAASIECSADPFLMGVAIGASCPFLTPIGHQCNALILGPGGYHFSDYWKLGLPLETLIVIVSIPLITLFWPFT